MNESSSNDRDRHTSNRTTSRSRRRVLQLTGTVGVALASGCLDMFPSGSVEAEATPVTVSDEALSKTGYSLVDTEGFGLTSGFDLPDGFEGVSVHSQISKYRRNGTDASLPALYFGLSVPIAKVSGRTIDPLREMNEREIIETEGGVIDTAFSNNYGTVTVSGKNGTKSINLLGTTTDLVTFDGTAKKDGASTDLRFFVAKTVDDGDQIAVVGAQPSNAANEDAFRRLTRALQHG
ncbi:DUF6517 family protein [Haladaptatus sp. T7]|uniref:DUF6517 family protein n=1 Tax=Haladaptatus sp. T7 TaxID=2029368 RepID=UPI00222FB499|nr:DUF6517 family protein [Haladaptatus sp. T7]